MKATARRRSTARRHQMIHLGDDQGRRREIVLRLVELLAHRRVVRVGGAHVGEDGRGVDDDHESPKRNEAR